MRIQWINNGGGGYCDYVTVEDDLSVAKFVADRGIDDPASYKIRVNRQHVPADTLLCDGDRVSATPCKVEGQSR